MGLMLQQKRTVVDKVVNMVSDSTSVIAAYYAGLKSSEMTDLRAQLRSTGICDLKVVKNTLAKKAFVGTKYEQLINHINGPVILAFIKEDPGVIAKLLRDFSKEKEKLLVTALLIEGKLLNSNQLEAVANLPTKQGAITNLVIVTRAPIVKFVATLAEPIAKLTRTIAAVGKAK
jgi:large subunit ribosomal protein L10